MSDAGVPRETPTVRPIRLSDRILIAGQTGKGKTELAKFIVAGQQPVRVICVDPKEEHGFEEISASGKLEAVPVSRTPLELVQNMHREQVHYVPGSFDRPGLEEAFAIIHETPGPLIIWVDETSEVSSPSWCPEGLRLDVTQGRRHRKQVIAVTQRLAEIHPVFRSQSEHVFLMVPAPIMLDLKTLSGNVRREAAWLDAELGQLHAQQGDFSHLWYCRDTDSMARCAPIPLPAPGRSRPAPSALDDGDARSETDEPGDLPGPPE